MLLPEATAHQLGVFNQFVERVDYHHGHIGISKQIDPLLPRLGKPDRFVPWLFKIARNKARDHARRQRPRMLRLVDDVCVVRTGSGGVLLLFKKK